MRRHWQINPHGREVFKPYPCDAVQPLRQGTPKGQSPVPKNLYTGNGKIHDTHPFSPRLENHREAWRVSNPQESRDYLTGWTRSGCMSASLPAFYFEYDIARSLHHTGTNALLQNLQD